MLQRSVNNNKKNFLKSIFGVSALLKMSFENAVVGVLGYILYSFIREMTGKF